MSAAITAGTPGSAVNGTWLRYRRYAPPLLIVVLWQLACELRPHSNANAGFTGDDCRHVCRTDRLR